MSILLEKTLGVNGRVQFSYAAASLPKLLPLVPHTFSLHVESSIGILMPKPAQ